MSRKIAMIAIGGNSLIKDKYHQTVRDQYIAAQETCDHIVSMIRDGWDVVIGHGNGPQVGFILRRSELAAHELHEVPMDAIVADTQGAIGYALQQNLYNEFRLYNLKKQAVTVITQVEVDAKDSAFLRPTKPIGSFMDEDQAKLRQEKEGWDVVEDAGRGWRRVVASPLPVRIVEEESIRQLLQAGVVVIAVGGGGIPVIADVEGNLRGVPAVIDKDYAASLLASNIGADIFIISTSVEKVALNYQKPNQQWLDHLTVSQAKQYLAEGHFAKGSMGPKIQAIIWYLEKGGKHAIVSNPDNLERALTGKTGTHITPD
ncbi:MAG: carbamate kinase [Anaerolineae bacterium]|nr:carbamate kinase [Anaerolineae bacterium]